MAASITYILHELVDFLHGFLAGLGSSRHDHACFLLDLLFVGSDLIGVELDFVDLADKKTR